MKETEILKYQKLNELAQTGGIVILGGCEDLNIPLCEIRQAFEMEENLYNRSFMQFGSACGPPYCSCHPSPKITVSFSLTLSRTNTAPTIGLGAT